MWTIERLEINGGFLPGLKLDLPTGLVCIIGPRGSGKSTLAEAVRFALKGTVGASRQRLDLVQANIGSSGLVTLVAKTDAGVSYTIRRASKQPAVLLCFVPWPSRTIGSFGRNQIWKHSQNGKPMDSPRTRLKH